MPVNGRPCFAGCVVLMIDATGFAGFVVGFALGLELVCAAFVEPTTVGWLVAGLSYCVVFGVAPATPAPSVPSKAADATAHNVNLTLFLIPP
jgi:hypothetical protein